MMFTEKELAYIKSQLLARLATVSADGQPDAAAVGYRFDGNHFIIGGMNLPATRKYKNVAAGQSRVALIIDHLATVEPWRPRGIRVYGTAEPVETDGQFGRGHYLRIRPEVSWSWDIEGPSMVSGRFVPHRTVHHRGEYSDSN